MGYTSDLPVACVLCHQEENMIAGQLRTYPVHRAKQEVLIDISTTSASPPEEGSAIEATFPELRSNGDNYIGAWFPGKLRRREDGWYIEHTKFHEEDGSPLLEECAWENIRPAPPEYDVPMTLHRGDTVEAEWEYVFWQAVVVEDVNLKQRPRIKVYFPQSNDVRFLSTGRFRAAFDWDGTQWKQRLQVAMEYLHEKCAEWCGSVRALDGTIQDLGRILSQANHVDGQPEAKQHPTNKKRKLVRLSDTKSKLQPAAKRPNCKEAVYYLRRSQRNVVCRNLHEGNMLKVSSSSEREDDIESMSSSDGEDDPRPTRKPVRRAMRRSSRDRKKPVTYDEEALAGMHPSTDQFSPKHENKDEEDEEEKCAVCSKSERQDIMLECDACFEGYHTYCLVPALDAVPESAEPWYCPECCTNATATEDKECDICGAFGGADLRKCDKCLAYLHIHCLPEDSSHVRCFWCTAGLPEVEDILGSREDTREASAKDRKGRARLQYFVKWKGKSHANNSWIGKTALERIQKNKLVGYTRRIGAGNIEEPDIPLEWLMVDRIVARRLKAGSEKFDADTLPEYLKQCGQLRHYQYDGLNWLLRKFCSSTSVILADEMGLGKTVQTASFLSCIMNEQLADHPALVVVPMTTISLWERELRKWCPKLNAVTYHGDQQAREMIVEYEFADAPEGGIWSSSRPRGKRSRPSCAFDVVITTYEIAIKDTSTLNKFKWLKGRTSHLGSALRAQHARFRLLLTGTPLQNNLDELYNLLAFLSPVKGSPDRIKEDHQQLAEKQLIADFAARHTAAKPSEGVVKSELQSPSAADAAQERAAEPDNADSMLSPFIIKELHNYLGPRMLRRLKKDVIKEMPVKKVRIVPTGLTPLQRQLYKDIVQKNVESINFGVESGRRTGLLNILKELQKCCNHPYLFPTAEPKENHTPAELDKLLVAASGKTLLLQQMLPRLCQAGHRILLFCQRQIDAFNRPGCSVPVFLISTKAGSLGINLPSADTVIIYDPDFNPFNDLQAQGRAHRIGQQNVVMVYQLITASSVEERIYELAKSKLRLEHAVVQSINKTQVTTKLLAEVLKHGTANLLKAGEDDGGCSITYRDEEIDFFLDRDAVRPEDGTDQHGAQHLLGAVGGSGLLTQQAAAVAASTQPPADDADDAAWRNILQQRQEERKRRAVEDFGRGRRARKATNYFEGEEDDFDSNHTPGTMPLRPVAKACTITQDIKSQKQDAHDSDFESYSSDGSDDEASMHGDDEEGGHAVNRPPAEIEAAHMASSQANVKAEAWPGAHPHAAMMAATQPALLMPKAATLAKSC
eukprot:jgi/Chlat1/5983/Chrsp4S06297